MKRENHRMIVFLRSSLHSQVYMRIFISGIITLILLLAITTEVQAQSNLTITNQKSSY